MATAEPISAQQDPLNRKSLRVIIVEDSPYDAELVERQLSKAGYEVAALRVATAAAFAEALLIGDWDVIIADYSIPGFGAVPALNLLKQSGRDIPFIIVSGCIGDETAVAAMRAGAHDYVLKDNIARLVPAIERELKESASRQHKCDAEAAVRYLSAIVESSDDAIVGNTLEGIITSWNRGAEHLHGYRTAEVLGRPMDILFPPDHLNNELTDVLRRLAGGEHIEQYETVRRRKDGSLVDVAVKISPIVDSTGKVIGASSIARDISERKRAEQALIRTEKLASVGRLAATIAHEVNNPLAAATNAVYLASTDPSLSSQTRDALHLADQELRRAAHVIAQTLGFCRETNSQSPVVLPKLIDEVLRVYAMKLQHRGITVQRRYKCGPCRAECEACYIANAGELRNVISNLLVNGMDALRDNGTLHVRLCRMAGFGNGPRIRLTIADNGCGIRAENLKRVFEPFFTTKQSVGTGLGLWLSQEIVRKYQGSIRMRSQKGRGTVFCITVPATPLPPTSERGVVARNTLSA